MDYYELRKLVATKVVPRQVKLLDSFSEQKLFKEKGRKGNYHQYSLLEAKMMDRKRLLNTEVINGFLEISLRASACPLPFNIDVWDGLVCPFGCLYCFANNFRQSLYTSFFDNSKSLGLRHCDPDFYKKRIDKMIPLRDLSEEEKLKLVGVNKAFALGIPIRMGIRFEDFLIQERRKGVSLSMLRYLGDIGYPVMINTKSHLVGEDEYLRELSRNNSAVHMTVITNREDILKKIEPGAPTYKKRLQAMKCMVQAGVRVVARIEPYLFLLADQPDDLYSYMEDMKEAGVRNITFDTYSYTGVSSYIRRLFYNAGIDFDRLFLAGADSQAFGSFLLGGFMSLFRNKGFSCSTFDMGNVPDNDQDVCCEVGDWFGGKYNYGCSVIAARFIKQNEGRDVCWKDFEKYVNYNGGFLTEELKEEVHRLWNIDGNFAYSHSWAKGLQAVGFDGGGIIWRFSNSLGDYRRRILEGVL